MFYLLGDNTNRITNQSQGNQQTSHNEIKGMDHFFSEIIKFNKTEME
jgi:hypothetical protein